MKFIDHFKYFLTFILSFFLKFTNKVHRITFISSFYYVRYDCMMVYYVLAWCLGGQEYGVRFSGTGIADCSEPLSGCWEWKPGPPLEKLSNTQRRFLRI